MQPLHKHPEYGLPATIIADFGSQYISERFRSKCEQSGITLHCSSPYHHQANSLAERAVGTCKSLLRKALEENECPCTALWIYCTTPLDDQTPSPHELLFGRKPQTILPSSRSTLKSKHPDSDLHQEANQKRQEKQAVFYDRKAGSDKRPLNNREPVFVWNALNLATSSCAEQAAANRAPPDLHRGHSRENLPEN